MRITAMIVVTLLSSRAYALPQCDDKTKRMVRFWNRNVNHASPQLQFLQGNSAGVGRGMEWIYDLTTGAPRVRPGQESVLAKCVGAGSSVMSPLFPIPELAQGQGCFLTLRGQGEPSQIAIKTMGSRLKAVAVFEGLGDNTTHRGLCEFREAP